MSVSENAGLVALRSDEAFGWVPRSEYLVMGSPATHCVGGCALGSDLQPGTGQVAPSWNFRPVASRRSTRSRKSRHPLERSMSLVTRIGWLSRMFATRYP